MPFPDVAPSSVLIIGSGVFGLSTAWSLTQNPTFSRTKITVLDRSPFPAPDGASIDSSRIIRADYADAAYSQLAAEAQELWRGDYGADGRYSEVGLAIFTGSGEVKEDAEKYMQNAMKNVVGRLGLKVGRKEEGGQVTPFVSEAAAREVMGTTGGLAGTRGYVNWTSGWAHAEDGMRYLRKKVEDTGRVEFRVAEVNRLSFDEARKDVRGAELANGEHISADLTVLAAGPWTPKLIDLRGIASATGQALAYCEISPDEEAQLSRNPVIICEETGMFIIPPRHGVLKVARHGYGYANPTTIPHPEDPDQCITVSLPATKTTESDPTLAVPPEGLSACRSFLARCIPSLTSRPWTHSRICWYTDTPTGDWLITYHPKYPSLFIATGGSGHGYKFLPVLGDRIVDVICDVDRDELGKGLRQKWSWPIEKHHGGDHVWTDDWRGGEKGMMLEGEYAKA